MADATKSAYVWTGPTSGARYKEYQEAVRLGQEYKPGQAAGTARKAAEAAQGAMRFGAPVMQYDNMGNVKTNTAGQWEPVTTLPPEGTVAGAAPWSLETDPVYQQALGAGQASFNYARNAALADKMAREQQLGQSRKSLDTNAAESRRRLAGNYAARGMAGGAAGALTQAEARANAEQIAARTDIADQITALNNQYLQNYGAVGSDWTGTLVGQQYKSQAAQQALEAALARYGTV